MQLSRLHTIMSARLAGAAILLAIAGVFGTWRSAGAVSLDGFEGPQNGWLVVIFGLIALAGLRSLGRGGWLGIVLVLICAAAMLVAPAQSLADDTLGGGSGWGVWLTIVASAALAAVALGAAAERVRGSTPDGPRTSR
jgi:CDP-diglyceride synthetase